MSQERIERARKFVASAELPDPPPATGRARAGDPVRQPTGAQAAVVGSDIMAFPAAVDPAARADLVNASLLAQLVSKKRMPNPSSLDEVMRWYDSYFEVLSQIGFLIEDKAFVNYEMHSERFEAHEAILEVAAALMAGSPGALVLVTRTLEALRRVSEDSPWITLFNRESQSANTARFQMSVVNEVDGRLEEAIVAFGLEATSTVTQVLFFKFRGNAVRLQHHSGRVGVDAEVLAGVRDAIARKLHDHVLEYVEALPDL